MKIKIITVGKKSDKNIQNIIDEYMDRFPPHIKITIDTVKPVLSNPEASKHQESESILKSIPGMNKVILLDETGEQLTSPGLSRKLFEKGQDTTIVIGGAHGVTDEVKKRADFIWSISKLVFPHQIVRLVLAEQLYRAYTISVGHPYHHS